MQEIQPSTWLPGNPPHVLMGYTGNFPGRPRVEQPRGRAGGGRLLEKEQMGTGTYSVQA